MFAWLTSLPVVTFGFYCAAAFFSLVFIVQLAMSLIGAHAGDTGLDASHAPSMDVHHAPTDADAGAAFNLISFRSVLAFFTMFSWANAVYLTLDVPLFRSMVYGLLWGSAAMLIVAALLHLMFKLQHSGNQEVCTLVGQTATVYIDIPAGGDGEVRALCNGSMTHYKARASDAAVVYKAGTIVTIVAAAPPNRVTVAAERTAAAPV